MTVAIWPTDLPPPMRAGFQRSLPDGRSAAKNDAGPSRVRRRFSAAVAPVSMTIDVSTDGRQRFNRFFIEDCAGGTLPFFMKDATLDGHSLSDDGGHCLTTDAGAVLTISAWWLCMFSTDQAPAETVIGIRFRIAFGLTVLP